MVKLRFKLPFLFGLLCLSYISAAQSGAWYKCFNGTIDRYPVTMHLYKAGHIYNGNYYYNSRQEIIYFTGQDSVIKDSIVLTAFLPDRTTTESFSLSINGTSANGEWKTESEKDPKSLIFSASEDLSALPFDYIYSNGSIALRPKLKGSPEASFVVASIWPKGNSLTDEFLKKIIRESFGEKNSSQDIGAIFLSQRKRFFAGYISDNKDLKDDDLKDNPSYNLDVNENLRIVYRSGPLLSLAHSSYIFTGGAHGNYGTSYTVIDLSSNKKLELKDVMTVAGKNQLPRLLEKYFRKTYSLKPTDSLSEGGLFDNKLSPSNNFCLTGKGIAFSYVPYEIGPYALGEINIFIPFTELTANLQPAFTKLLH